jgi:hypothetical protein
MAISDVNPLTRRGTKTRARHFYTVAFVGTAPFGSLLAGTLAHAIGARRTVALSGAFCIIGAAWFASRLPAIRKLIRPIYRDLGILPPVNAVIQDSVGR